MDRSQAAEEEEGNIQRRRRLNDDDTTAADLPADHEVFDPEGVLEHMFSYLPAKDLLSATRVSRRWKEAARRDELWREAIRRLWEHKIGVSAERSLLFWRSLFTKQAVSRMSGKQIRSIFEHPLLKEKKEMIERSKDDTELQRFLQVRSCKKIDLLSFFQLRMYLCNSFVSHTYPSLTISRSTC